MLFRTKRRRQASPRIRLLELAVATRYAVSRLSLLASRLRNTYERTKDESLKPMLQKVLYLQAVLEIASIRLETLADIGLVASEDLSVLKRVVTDLRNTEGLVMPAISSMLTDLDNMISQIASASGIELAPSSPIVEEHARKILQEAQTVAEERLKEYFPS
jgi:division protein CdvB (Snf7/Vps24/ESCRT-III family)